MPSPSDNIQDLALAELHESDDNPREIAEERFDALKYALSAQPEMMRARPIIATPEGEVVCGNMRLRAVRDLGWDKAPVFVKEFSEAEKREWMLRDNQEYGDWVPDQLAVMIARHAEEGADTKLLGFHDEDVMAAIRRATGDAKVPEPSAPPDPTLAAEVMVEIRTTREGLEGLMPTLEDWMELDDVEVGISS